MNTTQLDDYSAGDLIERIVNLTREIDHREQARTQYLDALINRDWRKDQKIAILEKTVKEMEEQLGRQSDTEPGNPE